VNRLSEAIGFSIKEAAEQTGLSEDTIRYYEKISLLPRAERKENRHRVYRSEDIQKIKLINCLKKTGMPLEDMKPYLNISQTSDITAFPDLLELMLRHKDKIKKQIDSLQQIVDFIDSTLYKKMPNDEVCSLTGENIRMPLGAAK
jgi:MerR family copper efflux transcriptional regulator